jgi:hypothetical protein
MKSFFSAILLIISFASFALDEDEEFVQELESERANQYEQAIKLNKAREDFEGVGDKMAENIQKMGNSSFYDESFRNAFKDVFSNNPLHALSVEEVRSRILEGVKDKPGEKIFIKYPKTLDISVDILRDQDALMSLMGIMERKDDLKSYFYFWLGLIIFSLIYKRFFFSKQWNYFQRLFMSLLMTVFVTVTSFGAFYYLFKKELKPTISIIRRHI